MQGFTVDTSPNMPAALASAVELLERTAPQDEKPCTIIGVWQRATRRERISGRHNGRRPTKMERYDGMEGAPMWWI